MYAYFCFECVEIICQEKDDKSKFAKKFTTSFSDLSVLDRQQKRMSTSTKKHLHEYNKQKILKRTSQLATIQEPKPPSTPEETVEEQSRTSNDRQSFSISIQKDQEPVTAEMNEFDISLKWVQLKPG